jgi:putative transposase
MNGYQGTLPCSESVNAVFLTWRLHGTLAHLAKPTPLGVPDQAFAAFDRALDTAASGPKWLQEPAIARCVVDALRYGERHLELYALIAFCVMPNHVHLVLEPKAPLAKITKSIKGFTARAANQILGLTGQHFWHDDGFDRWIRNSRDRNRMAEYTECNPVSAGLTEAADQWPWSSASHAVTVQLPAAL